MPFIAQVAVGRRPRLQVFGSDYETSDGTGERDYIHVVDLAQAHIAALEFINTNSGCETFNVGTGKAHSVLDLVASYSAASGKEIPCDFCNRRDGDIAVSYAATTKAREFLKWEATKSLDEMCRSSWNWQSRNPSGYRN
jgi:UDP-glucose 4-epimerase